MTRDREAFVEFCGEIEPRLRRAFVSAFGLDRGHEAIAEALGWAWEHWDQVTEMSNPTGYLWRVGVSRTKTRRRSPVIWPEPPVDGPWFEPALPAALLALSPRQRATVLLVHAYGWKLKEVAELLGVKVTTVQNHLERAMHKLRSALKVNDDV